MSRNGTNLLTETVDEYRAVLKAGYTQFTSADMTAESWFIEADRVLGFMERAKPSKQSLYEDALIMISTYYQGGSGRGYETWVVSRTDPKQRQLRLSLLDTGLKTATDTASTNLFLKCREEVKLVGTIKNETFPGPPNYKDITKGDEPEDYWILKLRNPIDVAQDPEYPVPDENSPQLNVHEVQLNLDYSAYQKFLNKTVVVTGELTQGFTVHHKTAVVMDVRSITGPLN